LPITARRSADTGKAVIEECHRLRWPGAADAGPVNIRDLFPGTFGYRLRHAAVSDINP
jgi:hypothetical protein